MLPYNQFVAKLIWNLKRREVDFLLNIDREFVFESLFIVLLIHLFERALSSSPDGHSGWN